MGDEIDPEFALPFPIEFAIHKTPRSLQSKNGRAKEDWKRLVRQAARDRIDAQRELTWLDDRPLAAKILYFAPAPMDGDVDNIVKLILDGMLGAVYRSDRVIERVIVQKIEPGIVVQFASMTGTLEEALGAEPPVVYIRVDDDLSWRTAA
ncbi:RusA family crossover junction endodeoxyribonuclease [uncultured Methylobacterium sp.]|jgi:crossover junction endodeoxyribonuclease RusA|uniref:RusA family crossover junction endodeoxyribonuclease n=1 Tax=uncultured Methylobacterium sp. TaxID=157278 RepID=UPI0026182B50|nr:RusA family crossover junction endodeoxyribonuclease [uncultured Methylobacterium sp.]